MFRFNQMHQELNSFTHKMHFFTITPAQKDVVGNLPKMKWLAQIHKYV